MKYRIKALFSPTGLTCEYGGCIRRLQLDGSLVIPSKHFPGINFLEWNLSITRAQKAKTLTATMNGAC